jgi:hypothetical protein
MNIPRFTAHASLCWTSGRHRSSGFECGDLRSGESIVPAYFPGTLTTSSNCKGVILAKMNKPEFQRCYMNGPDGVDSITWAKFCNCLWIEDRRPLSCVAELLADVRAKL